MGVLSDADEYLIRVFHVSREALELAAERGMRVLDTPSPTPPTPTPPPAPPQPPPQTTPLTSWDTHGATPAKDPSANDPAVQAQRAQLAAAVTAQRQAIPINPKLKTVPPSAHEPGGLAYGGKSSPKPGAIDVANDQPRTDVNNAIWKELGQREGGVSAINTWDTAGLTVGAGFAAKHGQLAPVMDAFLKADPAAAEALKQAGFTCENGKFLAVDPATGKVLEGSAAIDAVKTDPHVLSLLISLLENPDHGAAFANAEWAQLKKVAGNVPDDVVKTWPVQTIVMVAHFIQWASAITWSACAKIGPDIASLLRHAQQYAALDHKAEKAKPRIIATISTQVLLGSSHACGKQAFSTPAAPLPDDIDTADYANHLFFHEGKLYWHLPPVTA